MKTYFATNETIKHQWYLVDASNKVLGRLASQIAKVLRGKHKPEYTPHADAGDFVLVINAAQIKVTGKKEKQKIYYRHTGYPGGIKQATFEEVKAKNPLCRDMLRKLKVYAGSEHPHEAQQPVIINLGQEE